MARMSELESAEPYDLGTGSRRDDRREGDVRRSQVALAQRRSDFAPLLFLTPESKLARGKKVARCGG
jgi:hypothetical protein